MKVNLPVRAAKPAPKGERALTLLEMMVAVALLMFIILGLTSMFLQTQKAFKSGLKQVDVFESERMVMDMITRDLEQMVDSKQGITCYNFDAEDLPNSPELVQWENNRPFRTNYVQNVFTLTRFNEQWTGVGYCVSNCLPAGAAWAGVGTLYRYSTNMLVSNTNNWHLATNELYKQCSNSMANLFQGRTNYSANFSRVADGVIHLSIRTFDTNGDEVPFYFNNVTRAWNVSFPCTNITYPVGGIKSTNYLPMPGYIEVELGMLEPETLEQAKAIGNYTAATNFLAGRVSRVHVFRQQIPIRAASR